MAPRPFWRGYLKLFHAANGSTGNRVVIRYVDAETGKPVEEKRSDRGLPAGRRALPLKNEDLESVALEGTRTIEPECFGRSPTSAGPGSLARTSSSPAA